MEVFPMVNLSHTSLSALWCLLIFLGLSTNAQASDCSKFKTSCAGGSLQRFASLCKEIEKELESTKARQAKENKECRDSAKKIQQRTTGHHDNAPAENKRIMGEGKQLGKNCKVKLSATKEKFAEQRRRSLDELKPIAEQAESQLTLKERASECANLVNKAKNKADALAEEAGLQESSAGEDASKYGEAGQETEKPGKQSRKYEEAMGGGQGGSGSDSGAEDEEKGKKEKSGGSGGGVPEMKPPEKQPETPPDPEEEARKAEAERQRKLAAEEAQKAEAEKAKERFAATFCMARNTSTTAVGSPEESEKLCPSSSEANKENSQPK